MSASEQIEAVTRNRDGVVMSLIEAWASINILRGLSEAYRLGFGAKQASCIHAMYRATFSALYSSIATIVDSDDGVHSLPRLIRRLEAAWSQKPDHLELLAKVESEVSSHETMKKLVAWRNKVIAHNTPKALNQNFYSANQVSIEELACTVAFLERMLNELSVNFNGDVLCGLESSSGVLPNDVIELFGGGT